MIASQKEFERLCRQEAKIPFGKGFIQLSSNPRKIGNTIHPTGQYGSMYVSHSKKLSGFRKVLDFCLRSEAGLTPH